jgi:hypothetical protein
MMRSLPILTAIPVVLVYGLWEGQRTNRWSHSTELTAAAARLREVPQDFGAWQGKDSSFDERTLELADMAGYVMRTYVNRRSGQSVQVLLTCGPPGPTSVHTPDICYRGAGFELKGTATHHTESIPGSSAPVELWTAEFRKTQGPFPEQLRIYWTWSAAGQWSAPWYPRWHFAGQAALYKLYVIRHTLRLGGPSRDEVCMEFLHEFLPRVNQAISTTAEQHP